VGVFSGGPTTGLEQSVLCAAAKGQVVDVGGAAFRVIGDVMDFAVVAGYIASWCRTTTVFGM
jgi:hypothetical protein